VRRPAGDASARTRTGRAAVTTVRAAFSAIGCHPALVAAALVLAVQLAGCEHKPTKEEEDAAKATFACQFAGERLIMRFEPGEVRLLTSNAERITLYQIPAASGIRYSNASLELRGKGMDLVLIENGVATKLEGCAPYVAPKPAP
jgi:membrane-bound inhibitor of C-type lysozyme